MPDWSEETQKHREPEVHEEHKTQERQSNTSKQNALAELRSVEEAQTVSFFHIHNKDSEECDGELKQNSKAVAATSEKLAEQYERRAYLLKEEGRYCAVHRKQTLSTIEKAQHVRLNPFRFVIENLSSARKFPTIMCRFPDDSRPVTR